MVLSETRTFSRKFGGSQRQLCIKTRPLREHCAAAAKKGAEKGGIISLIFAFLCVCSRLSGLLPMGPLSESLKSAPARIPLRV